MFTAGENISTMLMNENINFLPFDFSTIIIGDLINCDSLNYLEKLKEIKVDNTICNIPNSDSFSIDYDIYYKNFIFKNCVGPEFAPELVKLCPEFIKTKVEKLLVQQCYCYQVQSDFVLAFELLKF